MLICQQRPTFFTILIGSEHLSNEQSVQSKTNKSGVRKFLNSGKWELLSQLRSGKQEVFHHIKLKVNETYTSCFD